MAVPGTPITRLEKYWAAILDKIQGGGSAPSDPEWRSFTATGTLAAPFTLADLVRLDNADTIYGEMAIDATVIGAGSASAYFNYVNLTYGTLYFSVAGIPSTTVSEVTAAAVAIAIDDDPPAVRLESARMMQQGAIVDVSQYASLMPTTTTFVYHTPSSDE